MAELTPFLGPEDEEWRYRQRHHDATDPVWVNQAHKGRRLDDGVRAALLATAHDHFNYEQCHCRKKKKT